MDLRLREFQRRLTLVEEGLAELMVRKQQLEADAEGLRAHMIMMCLASVADLTHSALEEACQNATNAALVAKLQLIQQQVMQPSAGSRMAAFVDLQYVHGSGDECAKCAAKELETRKAPPPLLTKLFLMVFWGWWWGLGVGVGVGVVGVVGVVGGRELSN